jgi:hypothetical protein
MKKLTLLLLWLLMLCCASGMSESLENLIKSVNGMEDGEMFYDQRMIAAWPGLESEAALSEILDELLKPGTNENYAEQTHILDAMKFSREKIVGMILDKIKDRNDHKSGLNRAFGLLQDYTDDSRVFPYLIGFINDNRPMGRREPMATADYDCIAFRISDCAASVICHGLKNRGLIKTGDPAWGEPGGATSYEKADKALGLLKELLIQNKMMTVEQASARPRSDTKTPNSLLEDTPRLNSQCRELKRPDVVSEQPRRIVPWLWIGSGVFIFLGFVIWRVMKRRL